MAATEAVDSSADEPDGTIEFTAADVDDILSGEYVNRRGHTFSLTEYVDNCDVDLAAPVRKWDGLQNGDVEKIMWQRNGEFVYGVMADSDDDPFSTHHTDSDIEDTELSTIDSSDKQHVTMEVTVDVSDMDEADVDVIASLAEQYEDSFREVVEKSKDYGYSYAITGKKLADSNGTPFDSPTRSTSFGLLCRIGDKHERLLENVYGDGSAQVSDEPSVTAQEAANYYQLLSLVLREPEMIESVSDA